MGTTSDCSYTLYKRDTLVIAPCSLPFVGSGIITTPPTIYIQSTSKMSLQSYAWTEPDVSCNSISVALSTSTTDLTLSQNSASGTWEV